jgi:hypothetical protein
MQKCSICEVEKENCDYYQKNGKNATTFCKKCTGLKYKEKRYAYRAANADKVKIWKQNDYIKNRIKYIFINAKKRAELGGLEFDITESDIIIPEYCPVLGIKIIIDAGQGRSGHGPSIDRIDNTKGYTKDNIIIISDKANILKSDTNQEERELINTFYQNLGK